MAQILVQKWSKKSLKKVQLSKGRMVQSIFFFLRKAHYPNSSSFVLICFFVCFSCCFVCLLVMLHFSAFFAFSFIHQFTAMVLITTRCYGARGDHIWPWFGKTYTPPFYKASSPPFPPQKPVLMDTFRWLSSLRKNIYQPLPPPPEVDRWPQKGKQTKNVIKRVPVSY